MGQDSPIWPAQLDHLRLNSGDPAMLADFYRTALGYRITQSGEATFLLQGPGRRLVIGPGTPGERPYHGYRVQDRRQLDAVREFLQGQGLNLEPTPSEILEEDAVAVRDPDGWLTVFGLPRRDLPSHPADNSRSALSLPARLQHVVVATDNFLAMAKFYETVLGYTPSDYVAENVDDTATRSVAFYRTDPEHHSFAMFTASSSRGDHHAYETSCWNDIRDWADHLADLGIKIWWGPGRHGPGNNLFIMILDPHGDRIELSAEIEQMPREMAARTWPMEERTLNLWGPGWIRD